MKEGFKMKEFNFAVTLTDGTYKEYTVTADNLCNAALTLRRVLWANYINWNRVKTCKVI